MTVYDRCERLSQSTTIERDKETGVCSVVEHESTCAWAKVLQWKRGRGVCENAWPSPLVELPQVSPRCSMDASNNVQTPHGDDEIPGAVPMTGLDEAGNFVEDEEGLPEVGESEWSTRLRQHVVHDEVHEVE
eukprot:SAG31_NODE_16655_length_701_cov_1.129568_1_plen_132_part_00